MICEQQSRTQIYREWERKGESKRRKERELATLEFIKDLIDVGYNNYLVHFTILTETNLFKTCFLVLRIFLNYTAKSMFDLNNCPHLLIELLFVYIHKARIKKQLNFNNVDIFVEL